MPCCGAVCALLLHVSICVGIGGPFLCLGQALRFLLIAGVSLPRQADSELFGRVITVNFARVLTTKLGVAKPIWGDVDEYARIKAGKPADEEDSAGAPAEAAAAAPSVGPAPGPPVAEPAPQ
jgi:hypothetical protein